MTPETPEELFSNAAAVQWKLKYSINNQLVVKNWQSQVVFILKTKCDICSFFMAKSTKTVSLRRFPYEENNNLICVWKKHCDPFSPADSSVNSRVSRVSPSVHLQLLWDEISRHPHCSNQQQSRGGLNESYEKRSSKFCVKIVAARSVLPDDSSANTLPENYLQYKAFISLCLDSLGIILNCVFGPNVVELDVCGKHH